MSNQTVVITGASAGVGRAVAREYGQRGAHVALLARGAAGLEAAAKDVEDRGGKALAIPTDVSDAAAVEAAAERVERELGQIDVWVNNAMVTVLAMTWDVTPEEFRRVTEVNFLGVVHGTLSALHRMRPRNRGTIMQVGSALAFRGIPLQAAYCSSKHAIVGFTESLWAELLHENSGVHLGVVHLPGMNTPQFTWGRVKLPKAPQPVPPIYQPEVAARGIVWAADEGRRETWIAPSTAATIWGNRFARPLIARYLARSNISAQQTDRPASDYPDDNLFEPMDENKDAGAHGPFDDQAYDTSVTEQVSRNRGKVAAGAAVLVGGAAAAIAAAARGDD